MNSIPIQAQQDYTRAVIEEAQERLDAVRAWSPSPRREALIEEYEATIAFQLDQAAEQAERDLEDSETSAVLNAAIDDAQRLGCAQVTGAPTLMAELVRLVPGCVERRGHLEIACVQLKEEGASGELRLVRRLGSYRASLAWRAA